MGPLGAAYLKKLQNDYLVKSRQRIPLLFMADVIHGYVTIWEPGTFEIMVGLDSEHVERKEIFVPAGHGGLEV